MTDGALLELVQRTIASGAREVRISTDLWRSASEKARREVKRLCKLVGVVLVTNGSSGGEQRSP